MTSLAITDGACLVGIVVGAACVARIKNISAAVMALSVVGIFLTTIFVVLQAPDVAHAEAVVGAIVLPLLYLVAIGKSRTSIASRFEREEEEGP